MFSGLEDSGSDSSEDDPAKEEDGVSSDESHGETEKTTEQRVQVGERAACQ